MHLETLFQRPDRLTEPLYIVTTVFDSPRFRSRWKLAADFIRHVEHASPPAVLYLVEIAFGDRAFVLTESDNPRHVQLRSNHEIWFKEAAINLGVQRLPADWKMVAWVDADVTFLRPDWADETRHQLQHYAWVQMWSEYQDVSADHEVMGSNRSFAAVWLEGGPKTTTIRGTYPYYPYGRRRGYPGAPGLAWACRREAWEAVGGLLDVCILGSSDWYMCHGIVGQVESLIHPKNSASYQHAIREWQARAQRFVNSHPWGRLGVVPGLVLHHWHGPKAMRQYATRDNILIEHGYDPDRDLKRDWQGLLQLSTRSPKLRDAIRRYFWERNEDLRQ